MAMSIRMLNEEQNGGFADIKKMITIIFARLCDKGISLISNVKSGSGVNVLHL